MQIKRQDYNKIFDNGNLHYQLAKDLARQEIFGFATSHLILSLEELMKYQVIMLCMLNHFPFENDIAPKAGKSIFNDHPLKLKLALEFQEAITKSRSDKFLLALLESKGNVALAKEQADNRFVEWGLIFNKFGPEWSMPDSKFSELKIWINRANQIKQQGLYAFREGNKIISPFEFKEEDYSTALYFTSIILKQTKYMKSVDISQEEFEEWKRTFPSH